MAEVTARIVSFDERHAASLVLVENSRPVWILVGEGEGAPPCVWIPERPETILSDGLLMWMLLIAKAPEVVRIAAALGFPIEAPRLELQTLGLDLLAPLRAACAASPDAGNPLVVVLRGSSVAGQVSLVDEFLAPMHVAAHVAARVSEGPGGWTGPSDWRAEGWPKLF